MRPQSFRFIRLPKMLVGNGGFPFSGTVNQGEMDRFNKLSDWWRPDGPMHILYKYNYRRVQFIKNVYQQNTPEALSHPTHLLHPFQNLSILDVGCGAGFFTKSFARLGGNVVGLDPSQKSFEEAKVHSEKFGGEEAQPWQKNLCYQNLALGDFLGKNSERKGSFDIVTSMDVIQHVENPIQFVAEVVEAARPGGLILLSTISKNVSTWLTHILAAEYILNIVPKGTHEYEKFINPDQLGQMMEKAGIDIIGKQELEINWKGEFTEKEGGGNYMIVGKKRTQNKQ